jgi:rifampicin phosphotransferase
MNITWIGDSACGRPEIVGGKAANLSRLAAAYPVPPGFCLTTDAFRVSNNSKQASAPVLPSEILAELNAAYEKLRALSKEPLAVAVRSSAADEDGHEDSFAGQLETFLNVTSCDGLRNAVQRCWGSLHTAQAEAYRKNRGLAVDDSQIAVLVQQLVRADVSAVVFSANPITGDENEVVINASWGLGESIVGGTVSPDTLVLAKLDLHLVSQQIGKKEMMTVRTENGTEEVKVPTSLQSQPVITHEQAMELANLVLDLEREMGWQVDVECAYQDDQLYLLQCRPITAVSVSTPKSGGTAIEPPADFPVNWEDPEDKNLSWNQAAMHHPLPQKPLEYELHMGIECLSNSFIDIGRPFKLRTKSINGYLYTTGKPTVPDSMVKLYEQRADIKLQAVEFRLQELWDTEWLPKLQSLSEAWDEFDLPGASMDELLNHLDESEQRYRALWDVHFQITPPVYHAMGQFDELYHDLFDQDDVFAATKLLQGFPNKTIETGHALYELALKALDTPEICRVTRDTPARDVVRELTSLPEARDFLIGFRRYLEEFGKRGDLWGASSKSWIEDPEPVVKSLKDYMAHPDRDPRSALSDAAKEREQAIQSARIRLRKHPARVVDFFEARLISAQVATVLSEDHGFWIDAGGTYRMRRVLVEFGDRFARSGVILDPNDIFFLRMEELRMTAAALPGIDRREVAARRKKEYAHFRALTPPKALGTAPPPPPEGEKKGGDLFFGGPPPESDNPKVLRGSPGSPGKATGTARIVQSIANADTLKPGDILVATTTSPAWTPLFGSVGAVVTETGGLLSHCAVVAREYAIPAVVGAPGAARIIRDGQKVEVDGDAGSVRICD